MTLACRELPRTDYCDASKTVTRQSLLRLLLGVKNAGPRRDDPRRPRPCRPPRTVWGVKPLKLGPAQQNRSREGRLPAFADRQEYRANACMVFKLHLTTRNSQIYRHLRGRRLVQFFSLRLLGERVGILGRLYVSSDGELCDCHR